MIGTGDTEHVQPVQETTSELYADNAKYNVINTILFRECKILTTQEDKDKLKSIKKLICLFINYLLKQLLIICLTNIQQR